MRRKCLTWKINHSNFFKDINEKEKNGKENQTV
jgi:hypothetical protein